MIFFIESDYKTLLLSMLSDYINSCESIRKAIGGDENSKSILSVITNLLVFMLSTITLYANTFGGGGGGGTTTGETSTCGNPTTSQCTTTTGGSQTNICQQTSAIQQTETQNCNSVQQPQTQAKVQNDNECGFKKFCDKINNTTCKVLEEIKECKCECNNICVNSDDKCKEFISVTMDHCEKEAECLIIQLNEDLSPQLLNTIVLRFIGLLLYLRIIQEFSLLRDYFTKIIDNLEKNYNTIKSCTCGNNINRCCSKDGKCLCTIFYKLFQATVSLHDRYCKIIGYMKGESDEDLYKTIPSLSLTRSFIILTSYFNEYIESSYMVEEDKCTCKEKNTCPKQSLLTLTTNLVFEIGSLLLNTITGTANGNKCCCHKYSSKLDDVVTLLQTGIEDTDDCDGLLSDVISMISPLVKDEDYRFGKIKTELTEADKKNENAIETKLQEVIEQKNGLQSVIQGIGDSKCDGKPASGGGTASNGCTSCNTGTSTTGSQGTTPCNGTIETDCKDYIKNGVTTGTCNDGNNTQCKCGCAACTGGKVEWTCQPGRTDLKWTKCREYVVQ